MPAFSLLRRLSHALSPRQMANRYGKAATTLFGTLALAFIGAAFFLSEAENPWGRAVQKRLAKKQELQLNEIVIVSLWWAMLAVLVFLLLLILTHHCWLPQRSTKPLYPSSAPSHRHAPLWLLPIFAAIGISIWQSAPRMSQSLWNDEEYAMRRFAHGEWEKQDDGSLAFAPATWKDTFFYNRAANNHLLDSALTHLSLDTWRFFSGAPRHAFSETAVRMPSLLAALGCIALVGLLGTRLHSPLLGASAALLLAFVPWHVHYASDGKGYSELMFFLLLHAWALLNALQTNRLRWWLLFAFAEAAYILSFPAAIYIAVVTNALVLIEIARRKQWGIFPTLIAFNLIGAIPVILWAAPSIPQAVEYLGGDDNLRLGMGGAWLRDFFCSLYLGFGYQNPLPDQHFGTSWTTFHHATPWLLHSGFAIYLTSTLALIGLILAVFKGLATRLVILAPILAAILSYLQNSANNSPMVVWHFVFIIPSVALMICLGIITLTRQHRVLATTLLILFISTYAYSVRDATQRKRLHDRQPIRQTAHWITQQSPDALIATWGVSDNQSRSYLPRAQALKKLNELTALETQASTENLPLYVFFCGEVSATAQRNPDLIQHIRQSGQYREVATFPGLEELFTYHIFRWQPVLPAPATPSAPPTPSTPTATAPAPAPPAPPAVDGSETR